jgi:hypothetical protein
VAYACLLKGGSRSAIVAASLVMLCSVSCEGERREYPKNLLAATPAAADPPAMNPTDGAGGAPNLGVSEPSSSESTNVSRLQPVAAEEGSSEVDSTPPTCSDGATESCGPAREEGICKFGTRTCLGGEWGDCVGAIFGKDRDCSSTADNDCDGQPDDTLDDVCRCPAGAPRACDEHDGLDGRGPCQPGKQVCILADGNRSTDWGPCAGSVGPSDADSCSIPGDDANCDGTPNSGCACVEGMTVPCGPDTDNGVCQRGTSTCRNGAFSVCQGAVFPGRRDCSSALDNDCDGLPDNTIDTTCTCVIGDVQPCATHPGRDGNGPCRPGQQVCEAGMQNVTSRFGACNGSVGPAQRDLCTARGDDSDCNGTPNGGCQCIAGGGNGPCSGDANNSRCSPQGTCAPCQADADCLLVSGGRTVCSAGRCVAPRCGDGIVTAGETCDDGNSIDTDACTNACQPGLNLPVVTVQRFAWTSRQGPVDMGPMQGRACFFTGVGGRFNQAGDSVQIVAQSGRWVLTGATDPVGTNQFVEAEAACVAGSVTNESSVQATPSARGGVDLESLATHTCFLTRVAGNFRTGSENVQLSTSTGIWRLVGTAQQAAGVAASARCIPIQPFSQISLLAFGSPSPVVLDPQLNGACYLARVSGEFEAEGDLVDIEWTGNRWELRRSVDSTLQAAAACFGRNDGSGVPAL